MWEEEEETIQKCGNKKKNIRMYRRKRKTKHVQRGGEKETGRRRI